MSTLLAALIFLTATVAGARDPLPQVAATVQAFSEGDRVVFIGDSITQGGGYHANIFLYYVTRFPHRPFSVYNAGISGDTTPGTNERFDSDIAVNRPNVATIMLGMNDAWAWCFVDRDEELVEWKLKGREKAYSTYTVEMKRLADSLKDLGCRIVFIKPSIYDETAQLNQRNLIGKNTLLGRFGKFLEKIAPEYGGEVVDFHTPMGELNAKLQQDDPTSTIVGRDRVHPHAPGHFVMSYEFLKSQGMPAIVSAIEIDAAAGEVRRQANCKIKRGAELTPHRLDFVCLEEALPYPIASDQLDALDWVPFQTELNQQTFQVSGLDSGSYRLSIDGTLVGVYPAEVLAEGINQSDNTATPQHKQALTVSTTDSKRRGVVDQLRAIVRVRHTMLNKLDPPVNENEPVAVAAALAAHVEKSRDKPWYGYLQSQVKTYLEAAPREAALKRQTEELMESLWEINQPKPHRWVLEPIEG